MQRSGRFNLSASRFVLGLSFLFAFGWSFSAPAQEVKYTLRLRNRTRDAGYILRLAKRRLRSELMAHGFEVSRSVRKGYWFRLTMSIQEETEEGDPPSCVILLKLQMITLPNRRIVMRASASGRAHFNRATKLTLPLLRRLRKMALRYAVKSLVGNLRGAVAKVEAKLRSLKKGQVLGTLLRGPHRSRGGGSHRVMKRLKKLNGRIPHLKMLPPGFDQKAGLPPSLSS